MSKPGAHHSTNWRNWQVLVATWFMLLFTVELAWGQATIPKLAHLVRPAPGTRPLADVLAELSRQGQLPFSYSSSLVPVAHRCTLRPGPARPLGEVLREVLAAEQLSYGLLAGHLVLWPSRLAPPAGVVAVNGRATAPVQRARTTPSVAIPAADRAAKATTSVALSGNPAGLSASTSGAAAPPLSSLAKQQARATAASGEVAAKRPLRNSKAVSPSAQAGANLVSNSRLKAQRPRPLPTAEQASTKPRAEVGLAALPRNSRSRTRPAEQGQADPRKLASVSAPTRAVNQRPRGPGQISEPLALLTPLATPLKVTLEVGSAPLLRQGPTGESSAAAPPSVSKPTSSTDSSTQKPRVLVGLLRRGYLHGEVWGSESLPLNAGLKLGVPRLYLVLGAATEPLGHRTDWAWSVGAGTTGRPWGRFTPSLDLMHWFLTDNRETTQGRLTQLRPALAWQLKQGRRWQLVGGPTLNLATARRERSRTHWQLGQQQWLWLDSNNGPTLLRLWPGVQLGLRF